MNPDKTLFAATASSAEAKGFTLLKKILGYYGVLNPVDIFYLASMASFKTFKKGEHLILAGEMNYTCMTVLRGLLRSYIVNEAGDEHTILFIPAKKNAGSSQTLLRNLPSVENIVAIENTLVAAVDFRKFEKLAQSRPKLLHLQNKVLKEVLAFTIDQSLFHVLLTPEQRYLEFCRKFPRLEQRVTQRDLASYLGVTATSLSRMRARIAHA